MNRDEPRDERSSAGRYVEPVAGVYDDEISLQPLLKTLWSYRHVISLAVAGAMAIFVVAVLAAAVLLPVERLGTLEFRLLFEGASEGQYPNGTPFSSAEITSTPVLTEVFETNDLEPYGSYEDFKNSIFVLQSNRELELLSYEYQAKLAASGLSPVDRAGIEEEFQTRRDSLTDPRFSLNVRADERVAEMPPSLVSKVLDDTLATWARQADERKGALRYNIPVFSKNILRWDLDRGRGLHHRHRYPSGAGETGHRQYRRDRDLARRGGHPDRRRAHVASGDPRQPGRRLAFPDPAAGRDDPDDRTFEGS